MQLESSKQRSAIRSYSDINRVIVSVCHVTTLLFSTAILPSSTFLVNGDAYILPYRLHTYLGLNSNGSP